MFAASGDSTSDLDSFKNLWSAFVRSSSSLMESERIRPEEEQGFLETKRRVVERAQRLVAGDGGMPAPVAETVRALDSFRGIASLSDAELSELRGTIRRADAEIDAWITKERRRGVYREGLEKNTRLERIQVFVVVPLVFAALVALFVFFGLMFFLNR